MTATVRLDSTLETVLNSLSKKLHRKKSDIIRDAIAQYANMIENDSKKRMHHAIKKTKEADMHIYDTITGTLDDGI